jgi:hypothetical protein
VVQGGEFCAVNSCLNLCYLSNIEQTPISVCGNFGDSGGLQTDSSYPAAGKRKTGHNVRQNPTT